MEILETIFQKTRGRDYPYLGRFTKADGNYVIVLFIAEDTGFVVFSTNSVFWTIGGRLNVWTEDRFTPYKGVIALYNTTSS